MHAEEFYLEFISLMKEHYIFENGKTYMEIYKDFPAFTKLINYTIIPQIIKKAGYKNQNEYFRIDVIGWDKNNNEQTNKQIEAESKPLGLYKHLWNLKIAVEHENNQSDWTDELIKLAHIRCPLKVIIGYSPFDERDMEENEKLNFAHTCLLKTDAFDSMADEEFLLIFGNCASRRKNNLSYNTFDYKGYVLRKGYSKFLPLI